jgi:S-adenosylmethionine:tRNA ribosyltransferase-isomerase
MAEGLNLNQFSYDLPKDRIAKYPLTDRSSSKLLFYNKGAISHHQYKTLDELIPEGSLMMFNDTKVIPARIIVFKPTGARIEIFLLEPIAPSGSHEEVMNAKGVCEWQCMIGNAKKWPMHTTIDLEIEGIEVNVYRASENKVLFRWDGDIVFSELLLKIGKIPLPPYIDREATEEDIPRYQTVYSKNEGAVAAPTAGLHFTDELLHKLDEKNVERDFLTLHISAGTFQPIKTSDVMAHPMHEEKVLVSKRNVENIRDAKSIVAVGTTSMRTLESLYWYGALLANNPEADFFIPKLFPYDHEDMTLQESMSEVIAYMEKKNITILHGATEIMIFPKYKFRVCNGLVTNFHMSESTLIMLISAFIGEDWRKVYSEALKNDYRFLSYGDGSFLIPS